MKKLTIALLILMTSLTSAFAIVDDMADLYHERIEQRYQHINFESFTAISEEEVPAQIQELRQRQLDDMNHFAQTYDLYRLGWSYNNHANVTEVTIEGGEVILYTFSIVISKNGQPSGRRFYQASKRVDGVFFIERVSDYEYK